MNVARDSMGLRPFEAKWLTPREILMADSERLAELDEARSGLLDGQTYTEMFVVLADLSECCAIARFAEGFSVHSMTTFQLDTFAKLCRLADRMAAERADAIDRELAA